MLNLDGHTNSDKIVIAETCFKSGEWHWECNRGSAARYLALFLAN